MNIKINLESLSKGLLEIVMDDKVVSSSIPSKPASIPCTRDKSAVDVPVEVKYYTVAEIKKEINKHGKCFNNGIFTALLEREGFIKSLGNKHYAPTKKWDMTMGQTAKILSSSNKDLLGRVYVVKYNIKHPVIRNIMNEIYASAKVLKCLH